MTPNYAFALLVAAAILFPLAAWRFARRGRSSALLAGGACLLGLLGFLFVQRHPDRVAHWIEDTDLALLFPSWTAVPAMALLAAIAPLTRQRVQRALLALMLTVGGSGVWEAAAQLQPLPDTLARQNLPVVVFYQSTSWSCAPAAAVSLLRSLGIDANEAEMAELMNTRPHRGTGDLQAQHGLARKLEPYGRTAHLRTVRWDQLVACGGRALVPVALGPYDTHMIAVLEADRWSALVVDPLVGRRRLLREQLEAIWLGRAIVVTPDLSWYQDVLAAR